MKSRRFTVREKTFGLNVEFYCGTPQRTALRRCVVILQLDPNDPDNAPDDSDAAIQTCLTMKVLFGMALRQTTGFVESLMRLIGLDWAVPDFSTLSRRQKTLKVNIPYRSSDDRHQICATCVTAPCARGIFRAAFGASPGADMCPAS